VPGERGGPGTAGRAGGPDAAGVPDAAILLGGGRAARLGGVDKPAIVVEGRSLADRAFDAVHGCRPVIAVGPGSLARDGAVIVREDPPFGGPVAALAAGVAALDAASGTGGSEASAAAEWVLVLACDLPRAASVVDALHGHPPVDADVDGLVLVDENGREQWLAGRYRIRALRGALAELSQTSGASMRKLVSSLSLVGIPDRAGASVDLDTWEDIHRYRDG